MDLTGQDNPVPWPIWPNTLLANNEKNGLVW
jgi:hypothetical protein